MKNVLLYAFAGVFLIHPIEAGNHLSKNTALNFEMTKRLGIDLDTIQRAVDEKDQNAAGKLVSYSSSAGLAPVKKVFAERIREIKESCLTPSSYQAECRKESTLWENSLAQIQSLYDAKLNADTVKSKIYLGVLIFYYHSTSEVLDKKYKKMLKLCQPSIMESADCRAQLGKMMAAVETISKLAKTAYSKMEPKDREQLEQSFAPLKKGQK